MRDFLEIDAPREWQTILDVISMERGIVLILGAPDSGKSSLTKFLIFNLCQKGFLVALVDADIGQSFLGPPSTIGLALFKSHPDWGMIHTAPEIFFVGSITPEGHFQDHLEGTRRMVDKAISLGPEIILIDTTGYISGEGGRDLKRRKIDLLSPHFILALQKLDEVESILKGYDQNPHVQVFRLPLSSRARTRSMEERREYRTHKFRDYFQHATLQALPMEQLRFEGDVLDPNGERLPLDWALRVNGLLVGLLDSHEETRALGLVRNYLPEKKEIRVLTPLQDITAIKTLKLSSLKTLSIEGEKG